MEKFLQILGALYFIKNNGYDHHYAKAAAKNLKKVGVYEYNEAIKLSPKPNDFRCFLNWKKINELSNPN